MGNLLHMVLNHELFLRNPPLPPPRWQLGGPLPKMDFSPLRPKMDLSTPTAFQSLLIGIFIVDAVAFMIKQILLVITKTLTCSHHNKE